MSVAYYIVPEEEIDGFDPFVNGKALGHAGERKLTKICKALDVTPLHDFYSQDPEELAGILGDDELEGIPEIERQWFSAQEGLKTVTALLAYFRSNPGAIKDSGAIVADLEEYRSVLKRLASEGVRWHLGLDF